MPDDSDPIQIATSLGYESGEYDGGEIAAAITSNADDAHDALKDVRQHGRPYFNQVTADAAANYDYTGFGDLIMEVERRYGGPIDPDDEDEIIEAWRDAFYDGLRDGYESYLVTYLDDEEPGWSIGDFRGGRT